MPHVVDAEVLDAAAVNLGADLTQAALDLLMASVCESIAGVGVFGIRPLGFLRELADALNGGVADVVRPAVRVKSERLKELSV